MSSLGLKNLYLISLFSKSCPALFCARRMRTCLFLLIQPVSIYVVMEQAFALIPGKCFPLQNYIELCKRSDSKKKKIVSGNLLKIQCSECSIQRTGKIAAVCHLLTSQWHRSLEIDTFKLCSSGLCVGLLTCVQRPEKGVQFPGAGVQAVVNRAERASLFLQEQHAFLLKLLVGNWELHLSLELKNKNKEEY